MGELVKTEGSAVAQTNSMTPRNMNDAIRLAELMCQGKMVPSHLQNSPGDCLMIIEQAMRWNMSPFAVAQCTSSVKGKLMFEGKLVAAAVENSGAIVGLMDYRFEGTGNDRKIIVSATRRGETSPKEVEVFLKDVRTSNEMWTKQPDQQLVYSGSRVWARRWTAGVMLGVYTPEEFNDAPQYATQPVDVTPQTTKPSVPQKTLDTVEGMVNKLESCEAPEEWLAYDEKSRAYRDKLKASFPEIAERLEFAFADARDRLFPAPDDAEPGSDG